MIDGMSSMKETKTAVSMIVLLYRGDRYLKRIVEMYSENCRHFREKYPYSVLELILVNDCPDEEIALPQADVESGGIYIVRNKENIGIHRSKIEGLKAAQGEFIFFLDQDDLISPYYFVEQYGMIGDCDAVICNMDLGEGPHFRREDVEALDLKCYMEGHNAISSLGQVLLRREAVPEEWKSQFLSGNGADDYYLIFMMLLKKHSMAEHRKTLYYHVFTGSNFSTDFIAISFSVTEVLKRLEKMKLLPQRIADAAINKRQEEMDQFLRSEEKYPCDVRRERRDNIKLINLYDKCLKNLESGYRLDSYIKTFRCHHIAMYGAGKMGRHFIYWMSDTDVKIEAAVDRMKKGSIDGIPIIDLDEAQREKDRFDLIVVTPMAGTEHIIAELEGLFTCPVISLEAAVYNMSCQLLGTAHKTETKRYTVNRSV